MNRDELLQNAKLISFITSHNYTETTQCILCNCHSPLQTGPKITNRQHTGPSYSINQVLVLSTVIELPRLHIPHLKYLNQEIFFFFYYNSCWPLMRKSGNPDDIDEKRTKRLSFIYNVSFHPSGKQEPL